jgi:DNA-binding transcriptional regulator YiaG
MNTDKTPGALMLKRWMRSEGIAGPAAAARLGTSRQLLSAWLSGRSRPGRFAVTVLERVAEIPASMWMTDDERNTLARLGDAP